MPKLSPYYYFFYCQEFIPYFPAKQNNTIYRENLSFFLVFFVPPAITKGRFCSKASRKSLKCIKLRATKNKAAGDRS